MVASITLGDSSQADWLQNIDLKQFENKVEALFRLGHFVKRGYWKTHHEATDNKLLAELIKRCENEEIFFSDATASLQEFTPAEVDGNFRGKTAAAIKSRFCACPDISAAGAESKWSFNDLTVWHSMGDDRKPMYLTACNMWAEHTPLTFDWWDEGDPRPNLFAHAKRIDGPGRILAWHELPPPNAGRNVQLEGRFDTADQFNIETCCHEIGHGLGLDHIQKPEALMYPYMNGTLRPGLPDIKAIQRKYGPRVIIPGDPGPGPSPNINILSESRTTLSDGGVFVIRHYIERN